MIEPPHNSLDLLYFYEYMFLLTLVMDLSHELYLQSLSILIAGFQNGLILCYPWARIISLTILYSLFHLDL